MGSCLKIDIGISVCLVIPCYNEELRLPVEEFDSFFIFDMWFNGEFNEENINKAKEKARQSQQRKPEDPTRNPKNKWAELFFQLLPLLLLTIFSLMPSIFQSVIK